MLSAVPDGVRLLVRAQPKAGRDEIRGERAGRLLVRVCAAPEDGKANAAVIRLVAEALGVAPSQLELTAGAAARDKTLLVRGLSIEEAHRRLESL